MCFGHYSRQRRHGTTGAHRLVSCQHCGAGFDRSGTTGPVPKYCSGECRSQARRKPGPKDGLCLGCRTPLAPSSSGRARKYCTQNCRHLYSKHKGTRPATQECGRCNSSIDMTERLASGDLRYSVSTTLCATCAATTRPHRYGMTARQIADRDGTDCRWCGECVDFALTGSRTKWAPSVDHIIPWSRGGTNDPQNLQLVHRVCNAQKGVRMPA